MADDQVLKDSTMAVCKTCQGFGHDKAGRPVTKMVPKKGPDGKEYKQHVTVKQGSGCMTCLGTGISMIGKVVS